MAGSTDRPIAARWRRCRPILRAIPAIRLFTMHSFDDRPDIRAATMKTLLRRIAAGKIRPLIHDRLPLAEAGRAHELLEFGAVIGKSLLKP